MNDFLDGLPSISNMVKLIVLLILAVIVVALVMAIVKMLIPLLVLAALIVGGYWLFKRLQTNGAG
jgi:hypothetical protein